MLPSVYLCFPHTFSKVSCNVPLGSLGCKKITLKVQRPPLCSKETQSPLTPAWGCPGQLAPEVKSQGYKSQLLIPMGAASPIPNHGVYAVKG